MKANVKAIVIERIYLVIGLIIYFAGSYIIQLRHGVDLAVAAALIIVGVGIASTGTIKAAIRKEIEKTKRD